MAKQRLITYAKMHQSFFVPAANKSIQAPGDLPVTLPPANKTLEGLTMFKTQLDGLYLEFKYKGAKYRVTVPAGNIAGMVEGDEVEV